MSIIDKLDALFPGRGAVAANILRNQGIWVEEEAEAPAPQPVAEPSADNAAAEGGDALE